MLYAWLINQEHKHRVTSITLKMALSGCFKAWWKFMRPRLTEWLNPGWSSVEPLQFQKKVLLPRLGKLLFSLLYYNEIWGGTRKFCAELGYISIWKRAGHYSTQTLSGRAYVPFVLSVFVCIRSFSVNCWVEKVASVCRRLLQVGQANFIGFSSNFSNKSYSCCAFWKDKSSAFFAYVILRKLFN